jgi:hypothetical protein
MPPLSRGTPDASIFGFYFYFVIRTLEPGLIFLRYSKQLPLFTYVSLLSHSVHKKDFIFLLSKIQPQSQPLR